MADPNTPEHHWPGMETSDAAKLMYIGALANLALGGIFTVEIGSTIVVEAVAHAPMHHELVQLVQVDAMAAAGALALTALGAYFGRKADNRAGH